MIADVADARDRLVKRMTEAPSGAMPTAIGRLADDPALNLLFAVEQAPVDDTAVAVADTGTKTDDDASSEAQHDAGPQEKTETADETETTSSETAAPGEGDGSSDDHAADSGTPDETPGEDPARGDAESADQPAADEQPRRQTFFDTRRIRDELNARLAKAAERDSEIPTAFEDARGLEVPEEPEEADNDAASIETGSGASEDDTSTELTSREPGEIAASGEEPAAQDDEPADPESIATEDDASAQDDVTELVDETSAEDDVSGEEEEDKVSGDEVVGDGEGVRLEEAGVEDGQPEMDAEADVERDLSQDEPRAADMPEFQFDPDGKPARFVWKINRDGEFSEVSPEFATAVGPHSADIIGRKFPDLARVFNLDPDHVISDLLNRRDTWSGKTVFWPIQGTDLVTPVDLAALPTYTRDRRFDGFRGFGIVRIGEARPDPEALGLALVPGRISAPADEPTPDGGKPFVTEETSGDAAYETAGMDDDADLEKHDLEKDIEDLARMDGVDPGPDMLDEDAADSGDLTDDTDSSQDEIDDNDPFRGERPAIRLVETPMRRESDKVISLEAHRPRLARESLSPGEQAAFREIGARLSDASAPAADASAETPEAKTESPVPEQPDRPQPFGKRPEPLPSAFAMPPRQVMQCGLDASLIDAIPSPLLVHAGDELIHANPDFLELTGYASLAALSERRAVSIICSNGSGEGDLEDGSLIVRRGDGGIVQGHRPAAFGQLGRCACALMLALVRSRRPSAAAESPHRLPELPRQCGSGGPAQAGSADALAIEAEELRSILETATDGVVILDNDGTIRSMNGSAFALFNYDERDTLRQPFAMLFAHESQRAVMDYVSGLADHGVSSVLNDGREVIGREASGGFLPLFMTIGRLSGSNGYCAVLRDITQWKRTEEELRTAKRAAETANSHKSDFLARVSHEIRTPLNAIIGFSEMMVEERFGPIGSPRYLEYAHDIGNSGKHVLDIVNDLLDISKIEAGEVDMEFTAVSLNDHLAESVSLLAADGQQPAGDHPHQPVGQRSRRGRRSALGQTDRAQSAVQRHPLHTVRRADRGFHLLRANRAMW
jgi:PAS domain S-box-containing protein